MLFKTVELEEAQSILLDSIGYGGLEEQSLNNVYGKVLGENIYAPINVPNFRKSPLDGFALKALDTVGASKTKPITIHIIDEIQAGETKKIKAVEPMTGVRIMTGAPLPPNADVVIKQEDIEYTENTIILTKELEALSNVIEIGEDIIKGELIFEKGELITPYHIGVIASLGISHLKTYISPLIGVLSTGNELREPGNILEDGQIYNSNMYSLLSLIDSLGGKSINLGIVNDEIISIQKAILRGLENCELIITTGGASVGEYDLMEKALVDLGAEILFNRINIKPGSPVIVGKIRNKIIIGLSGNPAAALISFELLVRPVVKKIRGLVVDNMKHLTAELTDGFNKKSPQRRFLRVYIEYKENRWIAYQTGKQQSSILKSMVSCNGFVDIPAGSGPIEPGAIVKVIMLN